jgi:hypothetical protein
VGLVLVAGCGYNPPATSLAPQAYAAPVYVNPMPYARIDPAPFMNQNRPSPQVNTTCYPIGMYVNCRSY